MAMMIMITEPMDSEKCHSIVSNALSAMWREGSFFVVMETGMFMLTNIEYCERKHKQQYSTTIESIEHFNQVNNVP